MSDRRLKRVLSALDDIKEEQADQRGLLQMLMRRGDAEEWVCTKRLRSGAGPPQTFKVGAAPALEDDVPEETAADANPAVQDWEGELEARLAKLAGGVPAPRRELPRTAAVRKMGEDELRELWTQIGTLGKLRLNASVRTMRRIICTHIAPSDPHTSTVFCHIRYFSSTSPSHFHSNPHPSLVVSIREILLRPA